MPDLSFVLDPINSERISKRISGKEVEFLSKIDPAVVIYKDIGFDKKMHSCRLVYRDLETLKPVAGLRFAVLNGQKIISDIYTSPDYRRQGYMSKLLDVANQEFKKLENPHYYTDDGLAFFNYVNESKNKNKKHKKIR